MIKNLYEIGKLLKDGFNKEYADYFKPWQNPYPRSSGDEIVLVFNINNGKLTEDVEIEKFSKNNLNKYLFRELAGARATSLVPTLYYYHTEKQDDKEKSQAKFLDKVKRCFSNDEIKRAYHSFISKEQLVNDLKEKIENISNLSKGNVLVTFKFDCKYVGEIKEFREIIEKEAYKKYSQKSFSHDKNCAVTYQESEEVWGRVNTLGFTVDDKPFSRSGFDTKESYKMFPVSPDAVKILEGALKFAENISKNFYGLKYFVLPHFIGIDKEIKQEILEEFVDKVQNPNPSFNKEVNSIFENETIIKEIVESENLSQNAVYYDIFFYQINNAQFLIKLHLSDVMPSQLRKILHSKKNVEDFYYSITTINFTKGEQNNEWKYYLTLANIKDFFSQKTQRGIVYHPYFFKIIESIFYGSKLNEKTIITSFYNEVKKAFKQKEYFESAVKRTFATYQFFYELNLFKNYQDMETPKQVPLDLDQFMKAHEAFFSDDTKKAAFFLGCLTEKLMQKQYNKLKSRPFEKYLNGLSIDKAQMKKIHLKLLDKMSQYGDMFSKEEHEYNNRLNKEIAPRLIVRSSLSKVDISYAFAIGIVMQKEFTNQYFENKNKSE